MKVAKRLLIVNLSLLAIAALIGILGGIIGGLDGSVKQMEDYIKTLYKFWPFYVLVGIYGIVCYCFIKKKMKMYNYYEGNLFVAGCLVFAFCISIIFDILFVIIIVFIKIIIKLFGLI